MWVHVHAYMYIWIYMFVYECTYIHIHMNVDIGYVSMNTCLCICIYLCVCSLAQSAERAWKQRHGAVISSPNPQSLLSKCYSPPEETKLPWWSGQIQSWCRKSIIWAQNILYKKVRKRSKNDEELSEAPTTVWLPLAKYGTIWAQH